jgi:hypothetical protein
VNVKRGEVRVCRRREAQEGAHQALGEAHLSGVRIIAWERCTCGWGTHLLEGAQAWIGRTLKLRGHTSLVRAHLWMWVCKPRSKAELRGGGAP